MARTALAAQTPVSGGLNAIFSAANVDGHSFNADDNTILEVVNGSGGSINVTFPTPGSVDSGALPDKVVAIPAAGRRMFNFKGVSRIYRQDDDTIYVDFSAVTSVTVALIQT